MRCCTSDGMRPRGEEEEEEEEEDVSKETL
jgi:hypothetical protein